LAPEPIWTWQQREKSLLLWGSNPGHPALIKHCNGETIPAHN